MAGFIGIDTGSQIILKPLAPKSWRQQLNAWLAERLLHLFIFLAGVWAGWLIFS